MRFHHRRTPWIYWSVGAAGVLAALLAVGLATQPRHTGRQEARLAFQKTDAAAAAQTIGLAPVAESPPAPRSGRNARRSRAQGKRSGDHRSPSAAAARVTAKPTRDLPAPTRAVEAYGKLPLAFEANQGQTDPRVKFVSRGSGYALFLTGDEAVLSLRSQKSGARSQNQEAKAENGKPAESFRLLARPRDPWPLVMRGSFPSFDNLQSAILNPRAASPESLVPAVLRMKLVDANAHASITGLDELPGKSNYFLGNDPKKWRTKVANYARVRYQGIYPGIDLVYYGNQRQLEYDFEVAPGADPRAIRFDVETENSKPGTGTLTPNPSPRGKGWPGGPGEGALRIDANGDLLIASGAGLVRLHKPVVYQRTPDAGPRTTRRFVGGRYVLLAGNRVGFEVGAYDHSRPLVIDPTLSYSTYLGGSNYEYPTGIAVDSAGNAYVVGTTQSVDFPTAGPTSGPEGYNDVFVSKLNAAGSDLVCSGYLGGSSYDSGGGIAIDAPGNIYVTGGTSSSDFPIVGTVLKDTLTGYNAFVTKIKASCSGLDYSTYLGGANTPNGPGGDDWGQSIAVDASGNAYVYGATYSVDFPTTAGAYDTTCGSDGMCGPASYPMGDLFVAKLGPTASSLLYSTYLGGSADDYAYRSSLAIDAHGDIYVTGQTISSDFPTTPNAFDTACNSGGTCDWSAVDSFLAKIDPSQAGAAALAYSTFIGGSGSEWSGGVAVDAASGIAYVAGVTNSTDLPTTSNAYQQVSPGGTCGTAPNTYPCYNAFVMRVDPAQDGAASLLYSTYLGGAGDAGANAIALGPGGECVCGGLCGFAGVPLGQSHSDDLRWRRLRLFRWNRIPLQRCVRLEAECLRLGAHFLHLPGREQERIRSRHRCGPLRQCLRDWRSRPECFPHNGVRLPVELDRYVRRFPGWLRALCHVLQHCLRSLFP